ncbi:DUF4430 domain-containing protein [Halalkalibacter sp. APA_J-10(15)]|uniref:DUF4430 domain-containing protein n=1 Tax=Halalkalibacter sp. APA_J-10(15) TaxID=2933805 RepID=UPI001FF10149|nr:DUF4430 domain-containing protein [Halalkalibacter sp. APA_J-10(15)]MCK0472406.1 DUF4430 domain-containing protein [Halalkalibacter sp. APA_J-10(15)]
MKKWMHQMMAVLLVFSLFFGSVNTAVFAEEASDQQLEESDQIVTVDVSEYEVEEGDTAFDLLVRAVGEENVGYDDGQYGKFIHTINGVQAEGNYFWAFYVNRISAQTGADSFLVDEDDILTFKLVDWTAESDSAELEIVGIEEVQAYDDSFGFIEGATAFDLIKVVIGKDNLEYDVYDFGNFITGINGLKAEYPDYWSLVVNDESSQVGASDYVLTNGDLISFVFIENESEDEGGDADSGSEEEDPVTEEGSETERVDPEVIQSAIDSATDYILAGTIGDWNAIALRQARKEVPSSYLDQVKETLRENEGQFRTITDYERVTLGILAAGGNPTNIEGYNLVEAIYNGELTRQGLNGVVYGLIALDSAGFETPDGAAWDRERMISYLLEAQNESGGWSWDGSSTADLDTTAMAITALAPHTSQTEVEQSVNEALRYIQANASQIDNSSTASQVIIALATAGVEPNQPEDPSDSESTRLVDYLLSFQNDDGGFYWKDGYGSDSDPFSTDQAYRALVAYQLYVNGEGSLYHLPLADGEVQHGLEDVVVEEEETTNPYEKVETEPPLPSNNNEKEIDSNNTSESTDEGERLPDTATNTFNLLLVGLVLLLIGVIAFVITKRRGMMKEE